MIEYLRAMTYAPSVIYCFALAATINFIVNPFMRLFGVKCNG